jgi:AMMECR1 domain-containing protein
VLTEAQRRALLDLARDAVVAQVTRGGPVQIPSIDLPGASGAFVTIKRRHELRGCLGTLQCRRGLAAEVARCAADAASEDPRFPPVIPDEFDPHSSDAFTIGAHGLVAEQGHHRGLLLPQVATEWGWTADQFLRQTCIKAGLPPDAWQHGARLYRFSAEVFGD